MIILFTILIVLLLLSLFFLILCLSVLEIEISNFIYNSNNEKSKKIEEFIIYIRVKLLGKITYLKIIINNNKINNIINSRRLKFKRLNIHNLPDMILKNQRELLLKYNMRLIKQLNIELKQLDLKIDLCTASSIITSFIVTFIATIISIIIARNSHTYKKNKLKYIVNPIFEEKAIVKIMLNCILNIKIVHIINAICMLIKKRSESFDERKSNRRTYVCGND